MKKQRVTPAELAVWRLYSNGLLTQKPDAVAVLQAAVGIQAQHQRMAELNLALRSKKASLKELSELYRSGKVVGSWGQRWTLHLFTYEDWQLVVNARQKEKLPASYYLGMKDLALAVVDFATGYLKEHGSFLRKEFAQVVSQRFPEFPAQSNLLYVVLQTLAAKGIAYIDPLSAAQNYRFVYAAEFQQLEQHAAIKELIRRYLVGFAPACLADFVKWSGIKISTVRPVWTQLQKEYPIVICEDQELLAAELLPQQRLADLRALFAANTVIAARFDSTMTGYQQKSWLMAPAEIKQMWSANGLLMAPLFYNGQLAGKWRYQLKGKSISFEVTHWRPLVAEVAAAELARVAAFLEKEVTEVRLTKISLAGLPANN